ncbi:MAG: S-methyl-5-thioribose-1-phosphate isomerase [Rhodobacteraceae bacterium]|nr:S-methyl-5-thioribose-1-phosphate isomerase [Paracoccaceae bacterium]
MRVNGVPYRSIWLGDDDESVCIIDQTKLPFQFVTYTLNTVKDAAHAIRSMMVRGAPLIGATAAYGVALAMRDDPSDRSLTSAHELLKATRPTAVNLAWALDGMRTRLANLPPAQRRDLAYRRAAEVCDQDVAICEAIGTHGANMIEGMHARTPKERPFNILTHCNAGWLATVDWGTALAPIYRAHDAGLSIHVWVDETRPRNQGAALTAWELGMHGVPHTVITDNAGGHLMQRGKVDLVIVGTDRTTARGDVCNKIGTYLKALSAHANGIPFYVAAPSTSIDWSIDDGISGIPIEERDEREVTHIFGKTRDGALEDIQLVPDGTRALNVAFDVTPARYVTGLITERGICAASRDGLRALFPQHVRTQS